MIIRAWGLINTIHPYTFEKWLEIVFVLKDSGLLSGFMNRRFTYTPHLTVGRFHDETELQTALDDTESFEACFDIVVTKVASEIIESNGDSTIEFIVSLS